MTHDFTFKLLEWFRVNKRALPWRDTKDPYAIWISEIILQQTRIQQGTAYWERFIRRWPDVRMLADASEDEVLRMWQGLGYYSRARNLHQAAKQIVDLGHFPDSLEEIKKLKGVGDYTAAAIASFAFNIPAAAVDGNVYRVLARYFGIDTPINNADGKKTFALLAQQLIPENHPDDFNQAMMDFGAVQCTPKSPDCMRCPMMETCDAVRTNRVEALPVKLKNIKIRERKFSYFYIRCRMEGQVFVAFRRRPAGDIWQGLWEPVLVEELEDMPDYHGTVSMIRQKVKHVLTHQVIFADFYLVEAGSKPLLPEEYIWIRESDIDRYALPRLVDMMVNTIQSS